MELTTEIRFIGVWIMTFEKQSLVEHLLPLLLRVESTRGHELLFSKLVNR